MILVSYPIYSLNLSFPFARESKGFHHKSSFLTDHWSVNQGIATKPEIPIIRNCDLLLEQGRVQSAKIGTASLSTAEVRKRSIKNVLGRNTRGGTILVGQLNLGGSVEMVPNPVAIAELAIDKQASTLLMPVAVRRNLNDLPDELWTKINIEFYSDPVDGIFKALAD